MTTRHDQRSCLPPLNIRLRRGVAFMSEPPEIRAELADQIGRL